MSKNQILKILREHKPSFRAHPGTFQIDTKQGADEMLKEFILNLEAIQVDVIRLQDIAEVKEYVKKHHAGSLNIQDDHAWENYSNIKDNPIFKENIDTIIMESKLGVAENGAVWIDASVLPHSILPFVPEKLIVLFNKDYLVADMPRAYQVIDLMKISFGAFIAGPSKTADIEQSLVYGVHGAKEMTLIIW